MLRYCVICVTLMTVALVSNGQQKWPGTFLWKISGKGLTKPSYLYGTIHLQDKRLFRFPDSLYHYIESADGFALEIDFNEMIDSIFSTGIREKEDELFSRDENYTVDKKKIDKTTDSLLRKFGVRPDNISKKDLKKIRDYRVNRIVQKGEMPTIVDGFLYGLAQRQGKILTGIEDVADQLNIMDEMGADLTPEQVFQPDAKLNNGLEMMMDVYIQRDLQKIEDLFDLTNMEFRNQLLTHRNIKMARRMDSLSAIRPTFFAVGVAHLPGDSGVITLLRQKGFTVEPVFSQNYPDANAYMNKLEQLPWKTVDEKYYEVKMPGQPSTHQILGEIGDMRTFFDLPTMTLFMTGTTVGQIDGTAGFEKMFNGIARNMKSDKKSIKPKYLTVNGIKAGEAEIAIPEGRYRIRLFQKNNLVFLQMAGSSKADMHSAEIERYFGSFIAKDVAPENKAWVRFSIPGKAFSVSLPGTPKPNKSIDRNAEASSYHFTSYDFVDAEKGVYYLIQVREAKPGLFIEGDTSFYSSLKSDLVTRSDKILSDTFYSYRGWPASKIKIYIKSADANYTMFNLVRGNRIYGVLVGSPVKSGFDAEDEVFNSIQLDEYERTPYKREATSDFYTMAPAPFFKKEKDSTEEEDLNKEQYISYDANTAISFEVIKEALPKYYWANNDSAFYADMAARYKDFSDSMLNVKPSLNGNLKSIDAVMQKNGSNTIKKIRGMVNGDTLYYLFADIPEQYIHDERFTGFFSEFRVAKELKPSIFTNKSKEFFEALKNSDSIERTKLMETFNRLRFEKTDLPVLHEALLEEYPQFEEEYSTINFRISNQITNLADTSTVRFVADHYKTLPGRKDENKYHLLYLLASVKTKESYSLLKDLLVNNLPPRGADYRLVWELKDSLGLSSLLFPDILKHTADTDFVDILVPLVRTMVDSNMLSVDDLKPFQKNLLTEANRRLVLMKENPEAWALDNDWANLLGKMNNAESNQILVEMLNIEENGIRCDAALNLAKNNRPIPAKAMDQIAADNRYRSYLYGELKKMGQAKLFPSNYATRQKIGESEIYNYATEDNDDEYDVTVNFMGEKTAEFKGKKEKFLIYKVTYVGEEKSSYLGIAGPYPLTGNEILTDAKATGIYWEEEFDRKKIDEFLKAFLKSIEQSHQEEEKDSEAVK